MSVGVDVPHLALGARARQQPPMCGPAQGLASMQGVGLGIWYCMCGRRSEDGKVMAKMMDIGTSSALRAQ